MGYKMERLRNAIVLYLVLQWGCNSINNSETLAIRDIPDLGMIRFWILRFL